MKFLKHFLIFILLSTNLFAKDITIFFTNDIHSRIKENKSSIGYAKIFSYIKQEKKKNPNVLYLDAGDTFHGTTFAILEKGNSIVDILNAGHLDAMILGNHDFNYGIKELQKLEKKANFTLLGANVVDKTDKSLFSGNKIFDINGIKVGVFGIASPETAYKTSPINVKDVIFLKPLEVAKKQVKELQDKGADIVIALVHLGVDESTLKDERSNVLAKIKGIDVIIDGHSHHIINGKKLKNNTILVQAGEYSKNMGRLDISIVEEKKEIKTKILSKEDFANIVPDKEILSIINRYDNKHNKILEQKVGYTPIYLEGERKVVRAQESNLGMLIADAMKDVSKADIAIINGGGIRASIAKGDILLRDILTTLPFSNIVVKTSLSGKEIKNLLEISVSNLPEAAGSFLHVSGITFDVNIKLKKGKRVSNIKINGEDIDNKRNYTIALPDFIFMTGDGYSLFKNKKSLAQYSTIDDTLHQYLKNVSLSKYDFNKRINIK